MTQNILFILMVIGTIVVGFYNARPRWDDLRQIRREAASFQQMNAELDELAVIRDTLIGTINSIAVKDLEALEMAIPKNPKADEIIIYIEHTSATHGVALLSIKFPDLEEKISQGQQPRPGRNAPANNIQPNEVRVLNMDIKVVGTYTAFKDFISSLETNLRITDIRRIEFGVDTSSETDTYDVSAQLYYQE